MLRFSLTVCRPTILNRHSLITRHQYLKIVLAQEEIQGCKSTEIKLLICKKNLNDKSHPRGLFHEMSHGEARFENIK